jgi:NTE family protein
LQKILPHGSAEKQAHSHEERMGYFNLIDKTISLMTNHMAQMSMQYYSPDVLIEVSRDACNTFDFFKAAEILEMGRSATVEALNKYESQ